MDIKCILALTLVVIAVGLANAERKRRSLGYPADLFLAGAELGGEVDAEADVDLSEVNERDLRDLFETRDEERRGVFDCARILQKCHIAKHCCGRLKCDKRHIFTSGICRLP